MTPERVWRWSCYFYRIGFPVLPRLLKAYSFLMFGAVLPFECEVGKGLVLVHRGLGVVVHPKTRIGVGVTICHRVTVAAGSQDSNDDAYVGIGDGAFIGSGATILPPTGLGLSIGEGAKVGANALVTASVPAGGRAVAASATVEIKDPEV